MNKLSTLIPLGVTKMFNRSILLGRKHSPDILVGFGIASGIIAMYLTAKASYNLKDEKDLEDAKNKLEALKDKRDISTTTEYPEMDHRKDVAALYLETGIKIGKLYLPAVGFGVLSVSCILASHGILNRRNVAIAGAYNLISEGFAEYRERVKNELGVDADKRFRFGETEEEEEEVVTEQSGNSKKIVRKVVKYDSSLKSDYARFFDEGSQMWRNDANLNLYFLKSQQNYFNDQLRIRGHVFLNEVYDALGLPRTKAGSVVGWVYSDDPNKNIGDGFIDFDIYNAENGPGRDFVNGYNKAVLLDFNVDGIIYDLI